MTAAKNLVLDEAQIRQKIRRIAYEIFENNFSENRLVLAGIEGQGYLFARLLQEEIETIADKEILLVKISLDKQAPSQSAISLDHPVEQMQGQVIILADDVLNTGRTLAYSLKPFLQNPVKKLEIAVLVNRSLTTFPVQAKYTGYELATTLSDHIEVALSEGTPAVYLR
ncbi:phosphoribosyltransferase family protein [Nafulsella turpanensis]|uniref:phosphoribosyltransferase family protein n=1 Tax=Nafulsella turpanensis TaxID=1265690 RepID=UPI00036246A4|nr:phosphoribosyltransferase family protein [Nafulsella turpanensis]